MLLLIVAAVSVATSAAQDSERVAISRAASFVREFYASGRQAISSSLPTAAELKTVPTFFSARLQNKFVAAANFQAEWIARHPDQPSASGGPPVVYKPPFVDGDIFTGSPDGSSRFTVGSTTLKPDGSWVVSIHSEPEEGMSPWSVLVRVVVENGHLAIDDVLYQSDSGSVEDSLDHLLSYRDTD